MFGENKQLILYLDHFFCGFMDKIIPVTRYSFENLLKLN